MSYFNKWKRLTLASPASDQCVALLALTVVWAHTVDTPAPLAVWWPLTLIDIWSEGNKNVSGMRRMWSAVSKCISELVKVKQNPTALYFWFPVIIVNWSIWIIWRYRMWWIVHAFTVAAFLCALVSRVALTLEWALCIDAVAISTQPDVLTLIDVCSNKKNKVKV